jgi:dTDP-4-dehydrorhamnose reductase
MFDRGAQRNQLAIVDDQKGCPTAADDIADAVARILFAVLKGKRDGFGTFHFANAGATTWFRFAKEIFQQAEQRGYMPIPRLVPISTSDYPTPAKRPANSVLSTDLVSRVYGITPRPWQDALSETLDDLIGRGGPRLKEVAAK